MKASFEEDGADAEEQAEPEQAEELLAHFLAGAAARMAGPAQQLEHHPGHLPVPEPGAYALLTGLGLLAVAGWLRRRRH